MSYLLLFKIYPVNILQNTTRLAQGTTRIRYGASETTTITTATRAAKQQ